MKFRMGDLVTYGWSPVTKRELGVFVGSDRAGGEERCWFYHVGWCGLYYISTPSALDCLNPVPGVKNE